MQRENFCNLQSKAYFNCVLLLSEKKQNSVRSAFDAAKKSFFLCDERLLFLISSFYRLICLRKKERNIPQDAA